LWNLLGIKFIESSWFTWWERFVIVFLFKSFEKTKSNISCIEVKLNGRKVSLCFVEGFGLVVLGFI